MIALDHRVILFICSMAFSISWNNAIVTTNTTTLQNDIDKQLAEATRMKDLHFLSRKRRYLEFPEGSSLQLVYNVVMGVVDYSNYISVSITMALAYALPSKPPSELLEDVKDQLKDGIFGINRKDTATDLKYVAKKKKPQKQNTYIKRIPWYPQKASINNYNTKRGPSYTPNYHPFHQYLRNRTEQQRRFSYVQSNPWPLSGWRTNSIANSRHLLLKTRPNDHRIYPIFGKQFHSNVSGNQSYSRSGVNGIPTQHDRIHIRYQRSSRHNFYNSIETYLERRKFNGHQCVLLVLCETGQRMGERNPGSFMEEIMRALFTMPEPLQDDMDDKEKRYDAAHVLKGNCTESFPKCGHSIWSSNFVK